MKFTFFHLMPYRPLDLAERHKHRAAWVVLPNALYDPKKGADEYESYIDQLVYAEKLGYDIESRVTGEGRLRFLEVKGRVAGAATITVTKNEILYSLNKPEDFILAIVEFREDGTHGVHYVRRPFQREPDFGVTSVNYDFSELLARGEAPR